MDKNNGASNNRPMDMMPQTDAIKVLTNRAKMTKLGTAAKGYASDQSAARDNNRQQYQSAVDQGYRQAMLDVIFANQALQEEVDPIDQTMGAFASDPPVIQ